MKNLCNLQIITTMRLRNNGFTLIELMLGLAISVILLLSLSFTFVTTSRSAQKTQAIQELQATALYASKYLAQHIRQAGYTGETVRSSQLTGTAAPTKHYNCNSADWIRQIDRPLTGTNQNQTSYPCLQEGTNIQKPGTDTLTVRYSSMLPVTKYSKDYLYTRSALSTVVLFAGKDRNKITNKINGPFVDRKFHSHTFYITQSKRQWCSTTRAPALALMTGSSTGKLRRTLVIAGIEQIQLQYSNNSSEYINADKVSDWTKITNVKVWIVIRSLCHYFRKAQAQQFSYADIQSHFKDRFKRKLFSFSIALRNRLN